VVRGHFTNKWCSKPNVLHPLPFPAEAFRGNSRDNYYLCVPDTAKEDVSRLVRKLEDRIPQCG